jgi:DNA recombination protein RmuC
VLDAKFPLEAFNALKQAKGERMFAPPKRAAHHVLRHVKDIAEKYLITGETQSAIMFVPSGRSMQYLRSSRT